MSPISRAVSAFFLLTFPILTADASCVPHDSNLFAARLQAIAQAENSAEVVLLGSSTIEGLGSIRVNPFGVSEKNAGIWGAEIFDIDAHVSELLPKETKFIVLYAGENDITAGCSPDITVGRLDSLLEHIQSQSSRAQIIFIAQKPSIARMNLWPQIQEFNSLAEKMILMKYRGAVSFVDLPAVIWGGKETLDPTLYLSDGLHFSKKGQDVFLFVVRNALLSLNDK